MMEKMPDPLDDLTGNTISAAPPPPSTQRPGFYFLGIHINFMFTDRRILIFYVVVVVGIEIKIRHELSFHIINGFSKGFEEFVEVFFVEEDLVAVVAAIHAFLALGDRQVVIVLTGGAHIGRLGGPLLLTDPATLPGNVQSYLTSIKATVTQVFVYGGSSAVATPVVTSINTAIA